MYDSASTSVLIAGATFSGAAFLWWPMAVFALLAMTLALVRIFVVRAQIEP